MSEKISHQHLLNDFIQAESLPENYITLAEQWLIPLASKLVTQHTIAQRPIIVGINGSQGSGKSTTSSFISLFLNKVHGLNAIDLSIDDFYLTRDDRLELAQKTHPLFATSGVPGTHDLSLVRETLKALIRGCHPVAIPRFNKAKDDRCDESEWTSTATPIDIIIIEGWCLGTPAQTKDSLDKPINELEANEDVDGR